jgi:hypothetical protein
MSKTLGPQDTLRQRALWAILQHAFFRTESALIIAGSMLLAFFVPYLPVPLWQPWFWVAGGVLAEIGLGVATLLDPKINAAVVARLLRTDFDADRIRTPETRARVEQALEYRKRIEGTLSAQPGGVLRDHLNQIALDIDQWIANIYALAVRLDVYQHDDIVKQDLVGVPRALQDLQARLKREDDAGVRAQIEETIRGREAQLATLQALENTMERVNYQLEQTLTALGTVYSQLLLVGAKDIDSGKAQRLRQDIAEQVSSLQDLSVSLDEVYRQPDSVDAALQEARRQRLSATGEEPPSEMQTPPAAESQPRATQERRR